MKSVIRLEIDVRQERLAELYANPENNTEWMHDLERYEPTSGEPGMPGSKYRLIPKKGKMLFVATVVTRNLPTEVQLNLDASNVNVSVKGTFVPLSSARTQLLSEEIFRFKGLFNKLFGWLAGTSIRNAHRRHIESIKRYAETQQ